MCYFPKRNYNYKSRAYKLGLTSFECGYCPECLSKKARQWALRCSAHAETVQNACMITLTYDDYKYDLAGNVIGELPPQKLQVSKKHCQDFIKRLRDTLYYGPVKKQFRKEVTAYLSAITNVLPKGEQRTAKKKLREKYAVEIQAELKARLSRCPKISYLLTAEYGNRTHRAHYHAILFNVDFVDRVYYKKSKRGNVIYKSQTLTDIWKHGICTIDSVNVSGKVARYCTKYCAKDSRCDDTFMLFSHDIGTQWLMDNFNGKSYILDGHEYPIPKLIWNKYILHVYRNNYLFNKFDCTYKYRSFDWFYEHTSHPRFALHLYEWQKRKNRIFNNFKRSYKPFQRYLEYWSKKAELYELNRPSALDRISALPDDKYFVYKQKAIPALLNYERFGDCLVPRSPHKTWYKWSLCPAPLVNKGQMTAKNTNKINSFVKTAFFNKVTQQLVYLRPVERVKSPF